MPAQITAGCMLWATFRRIYARWFMAWMGALAGVYISDSWFGWCAHRRISDCTQSKGSTATGAHSRAA